MQTMTTWKPRKKAAKRQKVFTIGLAVLTFFCGIVAGEWWGDQHSKAHQLNYSHLKWEFVWEPLEAVRVISYLSNRSSKRLSSFS